MLKIRPWIISHSIQRKNAVNCRAGVILNPTANVAGLIIAVRITAHGVRRNVLKELLNQRFLGCFLAAHWVANLIVARIPAQWH